MKSIASFPWDSYFYLVEQNIQSQDKIDNVIKTCEKYSIADFKIITKLKSSKSKKNYCIDLLKDIKNEYSKIMKNSKLNQSQKQTKWNETKEIFKNNDTINTETNNKSIKYLKEFLDNKNWNDDSQYSNEEEMNEYLLTKLLEEEKDLKKNENEFYSTLKTLKKQKEKIEEELNEQNELIKELKSLKKKDKKTIDKASSEYDILSEKLNSINESIHSIESKLKNIEHSRKERRQICYKLDYDEDIIDKAIATEDLTCKEKSQVCNLETHVCEDRDSDHPVYAGKLDIPLIPAEKAIQLENKLELQSFKSSYSAPPTPDEKGPRFVSMQTPDANLNIASASDIESDDEDDDEDIEELNTRTETALENVFEGEEHPLMSDDEVECFSEDDYATAEDLEESLDCGEEQICDISKKKCVDYPDDDSYINKVGDTEYTFSSLTNVDIMNKIKNKFKHAIVTPLKSEPSDIPQVDIPVIDMEVPPAHISERVDLSKFQELVKTIRTKPRLSVDSKFDDRTKARRDMIRECLNL
jgi:hypothetical protein